MVIFGIIQNDMPVFFLFLLGSFAVVECVVGFPKCSGTIFKVPVLKVLWSQSSTIQWLSG